MSHIHHENAQEVRLEPKQAATATIIWLHGLGADGHDFLPIVPELADTLDLSTVRFIFPHAPMRPVTFNNGYVMRAWHDIKGINRTGLDDVAGIEDSQKRVEALIAQQQAQGIALNRIALVGFSQGGAMALHVGLRQSAPLWAVVGLSTYLPLAALLATQAGPRDQRVWMAHGKHDGVVPLVLGQSSREVIEDAGFSVQWQEYRMQHQVCPEEITDLAKFLANSLA